MGRANPHIKIIVSRIFHRNPTREVVPTVDRGSCRFQRNHLGFSTCIRRIQIRLHGHLVDLQRSQKYLGGNRNHIPHADRRTHRTVPSDRIRLHLRPRFPNLVLPNCQLLGFCPTVFGEHPALFRCFAVKHRGVILHHAGGVIDRPDRG